MTKAWPKRIRALRLALAALAMVCASAGAQAVDPATTAQLLGKAHALEVRGRMDMARQTWQQILLIDPRNTDALAGMARAAKLEGKSQEANEYLSRLRAINPNDPNIERVQQMGTAQDTSAQLTEAGRLSKAGQYARAMTLLRQVYGNNPPPGDAALSYYQTEAATEDGRPHAIAGLRDLMDKYPQDSRYQVTLGKILTYNPRTREEGRKLLQKHPNDPDAAEALRQSLVWDAQNPATAGDIRAYLAKHKDQQLSTALAQTEASVHRDGGRIGAPSAAPPTPEQLAEQAAARERNAQSQAAYSALNSKQYGEAETRFQAMLAQNPQNTQALAGLGYVRMSQSNFGGAISYLQQAEQSGSHDSGVDKALRDSRFYYTMQLATAALNENDLSTAEAQFRSAAQLRPNDPAPLLGLGGALMKAQQPASAEAVFAQFVRMAPNDKTAWRGLFMAQYGAAEYAAALDTDRRVPTAIKRELIRDPEYLRALASTYQALGRDEDAQRVLRSALDLPFPADARGVRADMMLQYAALVSAAGRKDQAAGIYRQVLEGDSTNAAAYQGLISLDHELGHDAEAYQVLQSMPPAIYETAMQTQGFPSLVASVYQAQGHYDLAQQTLETYIQNQQSNGQASPVSAEVQLASIYLQHGDSEHAYPIYRAIVLADPTRVEAWNGLISTLHATGHDQEALAEIQQIPPNTRLKLETDPAYLQTVGSIYAGLKQPQAAMAFYSRVQQHYLAEHRTPPADIDIQEAYLLLNAHSDALLLKQLLALGGRGDLTDEQRLTVQTIWANWAVRRANDNIAEGNGRRALAILNASARAFPGNPDVLKALASGYAAVGLAKTAVEIYRAQDLSTGSVDDYRAAVGAALAANDLKDAEVWLRFGLNQYPHDGQLLMEAAKFETARGDSGRAADYYKASLTVLPRDDPGSMLTDEMLRLPVHRVQQVNQSQDLATLLSESDPSVNRGRPGLNNGIDLPEAERPYLPSYLGTPAVAPVQIYSTVPNSSAAPQQGLPGYGYTGSTTPSQSSGSMYDPSSAAQQQMQQQPARRGYNPNAAQRQLQNQQRNSTLRDFVPQSQMALPSSGTGMLRGSRPQQDMRATAQPVIYLHPNAEMEARYGPYVSYDPSAGLPVKRVVADDGGAGNDGVTARLTTASFHQQTQGTQSYAPPYTPPQDAAQPNVTPHRTTYPTPSSGAVQAGSDPYAPSVQYAPPAHGYKPPAAIHLPQTAAQREATAKRSTASKQALQKSTATPARTSLPAIESTAEPQSFATPTPGYTSTPEYSAPSYIAAPASSAASGIRQGPITDSRPADYPSAYPQPGMRAAQAGSRSGVTQDGTPIVPFLPASRSASKLSAKSPGSRSSNAASSLTVRERAAAIRRNQAEGQEQMTGQAHPPQEDFAATPDSVTPDAAIQNAQYTTQPNNASSVQGQAAAPQGQSQPMQAPVTYQNANPNQQGDGFGQQYPQPLTRQTASTPRATTRRRAQPSAAQSQTTPNSPQTPAQPPVNYPGYTQPLGNTGYPNIPAQYPLAPAPSDYDLQQKNVPPLRGYFDPRVDTTAPLSDRQKAELDLATLEGSYSSWVGGSVIGSYRSGTPGIDRMTGVEVPFEISAALGKTFRFTAIPTAIFLNSGVLNPAGSLGSFPVFGTVSGTSTQIFPQQYSVGFGGEAQLSSNTFSIAGGYSAYGFLVRNGIGRVRWRPGNSHFTLYGGRDPVKETQLSYAGARDPGSPNVFTLGPIWGGVVQTGGGIRFDSGNERSGIYIQGEGASLTGYHVLQNNKFDGTMGAYFRAHVFPQIGVLNVGGTIFGEHYNYNERIESYGWGGYFSPNIYFLFAVPVTFNGHYKENLHYTIHGSVGVQTFQESSEPYYPLDPALQLNLQSTIGSSCTGLAVGAAQPCGYIPFNSNTGLNYSIDAKVAYSVTDHWFIGGFVTGNNSNDYNTISGGFFARYTFKTQTQTPEYPTGLFPVQGFRPLRVP
jgi:tetratricopeptide (TPR) repeat protein